MVVRGERSRPLLSHVEILQNGRGGTRAERRFLPHWPQPGLIPRDRARGDRLARVVYKGRPENLQPDFLSARWCHELDRLGIEWVSESGCGERGDGSSWHDYSRIDAVLAIRPIAGYKSRLKPATKLQNAWLAGVPAILGREPAFRELRRSPYDYLEATDLASALAAVRSLGDPDTYRAMVVRARERAPRCGVTRCVELWERLLYEELPGRAAALLRRGPRRRCLLPFGPRSAPPI